MNLLSFPGIYKYSLTQTSKIIVVRHTELIKVLISYLNTVITNRIIVVDSVFKIVNKVPDEVMVP